MHISLIIGATKVLRWANNVTDLPVCTFFGSELATEIPPAVLKVTLLFLQCNGVIQQVSRKYTIAIMQM